MRESILVLGIETSCDETAVAILKFENKQARILADVVNSQSLKHRLYGGVVPESASRYHLFNIIPALKQAVNKAGKSLKNIDVFSATSGPGLVSALLVGLDTAKSLAYAMRKPLVGVNHIEGHILAGLVDLDNLDKVEQRLPAIVLTASGGHTLLVEVKAIGRYKLLGRSLDDAAGEAFDKTALMLGETYPGGPAISRLARTGKSDRFKLPRPMTGSNDFNFSFSGLKTAARRQIAVLGKLDQITRQDLAASFEEAVTDVLVSKTIKAADSFKIDNIIVTGGVSANQRLREKFNKQIKNKQIFFPPMVLTADNAVMIALAGYFSHQQARSLPLTPQPKLSI